MKRNGIVSAMLVCLLVFLLAGCGQSTEPTMTLEEKVADVQSKNEITTQDVVQLLELEGLSVEKQKVSAAFAELCPDTEVYKVNGDNLLLLKATEGSLYDRDNELQETEWADYWYAYEQSTELSQLFQKDYGLEENEIWTGGTYSGKNIIAGYFSYAAPELLQENVDREVLYEKTKEMAALKDKVYRVFYNDINKMQEYAVAAEGEHFSVEGSFYHFQTPYTAGKYTMYDVFTNLKLEATVTDEVLAKYQGQEAKIGIVGPINDIIGAGSGSAWTSGQLTEAKLDIPQNKDERRIIGQEYTGPIQYEVTFSVGDISETLIVGVDEAVTAEATAPVEK